MADHGYVIENGEIVLSAPPTSSRDDRVIDAYLGAKRKPPDPDRLMAYVPPLESGDALPSSRCCRRRSTGSNAPLLASADADLAGEVLLQAAAWRRTSSRRSTPPATCRGAAAGAPQPGQRDHARRLPGGVVAALCRRRLARAGLRRGRRRPGPAAAAQRRAVRDAAAANHGWTMYAGLLHGAYEALRHTATPALRDRYLAEVVSGRRS